MNIQDLRDRLDAKNKIREANLTIKSAKSTMSKKIGFTAEDREVLKANGGKIGPWLEWKKSKKEAAKKSAVSATRKPAPASSAAKPAPAASKPVTTATAPKGGDGLTITSAEFDALPSGDRAEFKRLGGKVISGASTPSPKAGLTGFARVSAAFAKPATAPTANKPATPAPASDKRASQSNLTGLARVAAAFKKDK